MAATDARTLAGLLASLSDAELAGLMDARGISPDVRAGDFYDLAEILLEPASVARGIERLDRDSAHALRASTAAATSAAGAVLAPRGLADRSGRVFDAVADVWRSAEPVIVESVASETGGAEPAESAAERAFSSVSSLADVLQTALTSPLTRIGSGALGAAERRALVDSGAVDSPAAADAIVEIAVRSGVLALHARDLRVTPAGQDWLGRGTADRWTFVADALRAALPAAVRAPGGEWIPPSQWPDAYPFDPSWPAAAAQWRTVFTQWAILGPDGAPSAWIDADHGIDTAALTALLPPEVDRVFVQNDLTAIAPGPLAPMIGARLRRIARRESRAQASTYRFTAETLAHALSSGETAASLRAFVSEVSLTGIPQPLAYEIERAAQRHGGIRVGIDESGHTRVTGTDDLIAAAAVDQALRPLGLVPGDDGLRTRSSPETTFWMLTDARYPVVALGPDGTARIVSREIVADPPEAPTPHERFTPLIARLRTAASGDSDAAWRDRELEQAVRERATVVVEVALPDGTTRTLTMALTGIGGGRLRGLDRAADVERTVPIASIRAVRPA